MEPESHRSNTIWPLVTSHVYLMGVQFSASDVGLASLGWTSCLVSTDHVLNVSSIFPWVD